MDQVLCFFFQRFARLHDENMSIKDRRHLHDQPGRQPATKYLELGTWLQGTYLGTRSLT